MNVKFTVVGQGIFPLDMLRYDSAYPYDQQAVRDLEVAIESKGFQKWRVTLASESYHSPNIDRWKSFMCSIEDYSEY